MKMKVLIPFTDKETRKTYKKGDVIEVTEKRFNEIEKPHYITPFVAEEAAPAKK